MIFTPDFFSMLKTVFIANLIGTFFYAYAFYITKKAGLKKNTPSFDSVLISIVNSLLVMIGFGLFAPLNVHFWPFYRTMTQLFIGTLFVSFYTDLKTFLISRTVTLYLVPFIWIATYLGYLPLSLIHSIIGAFCGYAMLWTVGKVAFYFRKIESLGQGDIDLLAFIGAFLGPIGCWSSLLIGSIVGSIFSIIYLLTTQQKNLRTIKIPFGTFLTTGAIVTLFFL